jgi:hypothetical protein
VTSSNSQCNTHTRVATPLGVCVCGVWLQCAQFVRERVVATMRESKGVVVDVSVMGLFGCGVERDKLQSVAVARL